MASYALSPVQLPWSLTNDEERFKKILKTLFAVYLLVAIPLTIIQMPEQTRAEREQLPPQLARTREFVGQRRPHSVATRRK